MRLASLSIRNYRCLQSLDLEIDDYTALVGANGTGKSSVLYALKWFFDGYDLDINDLTSLNDEESGEQISVTATFTDLTAQDRVELREYGRGERAIFRRTCQPGIKGSKVVGRSLQGPGFIKVRSAAKVGEMRKEYALLAASLHGLDELSGNFSREDADEQLTAWENDPSNIELLEQVDNIEANHMFGINGTNAIAKCVQLVLVPAATDFTTQFMDGAKGSAVSELLGAVVKNAGDSAREEWVESHQDIIAELNKSVHEDVSTSVAAKSEQINKNLQQIIPNAIVEFRPNVPTWTPKSEASITTEVTIDGITNGISRQGHGVQRSILIALLQSLTQTSATDTSNFDSADSEDGTTNNDSASGPALIVCIEEPEIYQHPVRARAFGRVLEDLAERNSAQVLVATHSPYFVTPRRFDSIRRFTIVDGRAFSTSTSVHTISERARVDGHSVQKTVDKQLPTSFSEGFFADSVVLVEGDTDRVVIEVLADRLGQSLDRHGISVLDLGGKNSLRIPFEIFSSLGIPTYVVADGDAGGASRTSTPKNNQSMFDKRKEVDVTHCKATRKLVEWLPITSSTSSFGWLPYEYGYPTVVTDTFAIWRDDLESELEQWGSFVKELTVLGGRLRHKHALTYRLAALEAALSDIPESLEVLIEQIVHFTSTRDVLQAVSDELSYWRASRSHESSYSSPETWFAPNPVSGTSQLS